MSDKPRAYDGGKAGAGVYHALISLMPPHELFVEAFLGGGAVMRAKRPASSSIGIERDAAAFDLWRGDEVPGLHLWRGDAFAWLRAYVELSVWGLDRMTPAGLASLGLRELASPDLAGATGLATDDGAGSAPDQDLGMYGAFTEQRARSTTAAAGGERRRPVTLSPRHLVTPSPVTLPPPDRTLIYLDPPYLMATRSCQKPMYRHELSEAEHVELLRIVRALPCRVMLSGYWSELYAQALPGWRTETFWTTNRRGKRVQEWVWLNFPPPRELHDYTYLGQGYRERERIRRLQKRWRARIEKMPELERQALRGVLAEVG